jgi:hypothetical protein
MASLRGSLALAGLLTLAASCSSGRTSSASATLIVTATPASATADGSSKVAIHVEGAAKGPISLLVTRGTLASGARTQTFAATPFDAELASCDAHVDSTCAGSVSIQAQDADGALGFAAVSFTTPRDAVTTPDAGTTDGGTTDGGSTTTALGQIGLASQQHQVMGARGSGFAEVNALTFQVLDGNGQAYAEGLPVTFTHASLGGSYVGTTKTCSAASPPVCTASGQTDANGQVVVPLVSGTAAGVLSVTASARLAGTTISGEAVNVAVVGAKANGAHFFVECTPKNVPAMIADHTCLTTFYTGGDVTCTAFLADRYDNVLGTAVQTTFMSEAGAAGPPVSTLAFDPSTTTDQTAGLGFAVDSIALAGYPLPSDVPPVAGEPSVDIAADPCGTAGFGTARTHNVRDGLVTIIALARGEEGFVDTNGNGVYDGPNAPALAGTPFATSGEPFVDLPEPFVDSNDNGVRDPGEPFVDLNGNGAWDGPNGVWDANTTVWAETRVLYTGLPSFGAGPGGVGLASFASPASVTVNASTPGPAVPEQVDYVFRDANLNPLSPSFTSVDVVTLLDNVTVKSLLDPGTLDNLGLAFTQQYCAEKAPTAPANCSSVCASVPCYVRTTIAGFGAVTAGKILVAGGGKAGTDVVMINPKVGDVTVKPGIQVPATVTP